MVDPNEIFAFLRVCPDEGLVQEVQAATQERLEAIQASRLGPSARKARGFTHVQPTDETAPGGAQTQPIAGPNPGWSGGADIFALAESNQKREAAQADSLRGPGPAPVSIHVGPVPEDMKRESADLHKEATQAAAEANKIADPPPPPARQARPVAAQQAQAPPKPPESPNTPAAPHVAALSNSPREMDFIQPPPEAPAEAAAGPTAAPAAPASSGPPPWTQAAEGPKMGPQGHNVSQALSPSVAAPKADGAAAPKADVAKAAGVGATEAAAGKQAVPAQKPK